MTYNEAVKHFMRFLKEKGIYKRAFNIITDKNNCYHKNATYVNYGSRLRMIAPKEWIQSGTSFCMWSDTPEKDIFWWGMSILWNYECMEREITYNYKIDTDFYEKLLIREIRSYLNCYGRNDIHSQTSIPRKKIEYIKNQLKEKLKKLTEHDK